MSTRVKNYEDLSPADKMIRIKETKDMIDKMHLKDDPIDTAKSDRLFDQLRNDMAFQGIIGINIKDELAKL